MNKQDYEKNKAECWDAFNREHPHSGIITEKAFLYAFDSAYTLGKQDKDAEGEEMLTVPSNSVRVYKENIDRYLPKAFSDYDKGFWIGQRAALRDLFGPKCLRDEPASEPASNVASEPKSETDKCFDSILKDGFSKERRLNVATQIMSSILSNQKMLNNLAHGETTADGVVKCIVNTTMMYTDALIAVCERSEKLKGE